MNIDNLIKTSGYLLSMLVIFMNINESYAQFSHDQKYWVKWIHYDSLGAFSAGFYDESGQSLVVKRKPQIFISGKEVPYDKNDLAAVSYGDVEITQKSKISINGAYIPASENQEYPFVYDTAFRDIISYDSCYFIVCPAPAILTGYDNELNEKCTKSAKFKWYDYIQTLKNFIGKYSALFTLEIVDSKSMKPIERVHINIDAVDTDMKLFMDSICEYLGTILCESVIDRGYLAKSKKYFMDNTMIGKKTRVIDNSNIWLNCGIDNNMESMPAKFKMSIDAYGYPDFTVMFEVNPNIEKIVVTLDKKNREADVDILERMLIKGN